MHVCVCVYARVCTATEYYNTYEILRQRLLLSFQHHRALTLVQTWSEVGEREPALGFAMHTAGAQEYSHVFREGSEALKPRWSKAVAPGRLANCQEEEEVSARPWGFLLPCRSLSCPVPAGLPSGK